jgi:hypothetical protein
MRTTDAPTPDTEGFPAVFRAIAAVVVPESADLDDRAWHEMEALVLDSLSLRPPPLQRKLRLFVHAVEWLPVLSYRKRFSALDSESRAAFLSRLQEHRIDAIRVGFWGLRTLVFLGYYGRATGANEIDYDPHPSGWDALQ